MPTFKIIKQQQYTTGAQLAIHLITEFRLAPLGHLTAQLCIPPILHDSMMDVFLYGGDFWDIFAFKDDT